MYGHTRANSQGPQSCNSQRLPSATTYIRKSSLAGKLLGWAALRRVDPEAHPPVGKKPHAIAAMALGGLGLLGWTYVLVRLKLGLPLHPL